MHELLFVLLCGYRDAYTGSSAQFIYMHRMFAAMCVAIFTNLFAHEQQAWVDAYRRDANLPDTFAVSDQVLHDYIGARARHGQIPYRVVNSWVIRLYAVGCTGWDHIPLSAQYEDSALTFDHLYSNTDVCNALCQWLRDIPRRSTGGYMQMPFHQCVAQLAIAAVLRRRNVLFGGVPSGRDIPTPADVGPFLYSHICASNARAGFAAEDTRLCILLNLESREAFRAICEGAVRAYGTPASASPRGFALSTQYIDEEADVVIAAPPDPDPDPDPDRRARAVHQRVQTLRAIEAEIHAMVIGANTNHPTVRNSLSLMNSEWQILLAALEGLRRGQNLPPQPAVSTVHRRVVAQRALHLS